MLIANIHVAFDRMTCISHVESAAVGSRGNLEVNKLVQFVTVVGLDVFLEKLEAFGVGSVDERAVEGVGIGAAVRVAAEQKFHCIGSDCGAGSGLKGPSWE